MTTVTIMNRAVPTVEPENIDCSGILNGRKHTKETLKKRSHPPGQRTGKFGETKGSSGGKSIKALGPLQAGEIAPGRCHGSKFRKREHPTLGVFCSFRGE